MFSSQQVDSVLFRSIQVFPATHRPLNQAYGSILREYIRADRDQPACHTSRMDGFAIPFSSWKKGQRTLAIVGLQPAGQSPQITCARSNSIEICTGAPLPYGFDCVIPYEDIRRTKNGILSVPPKLTLRRWQNIRKKGSEGLKGTKILPPGVTIQAPQISLLAAVGKTSVRVSRVPRIAIIGTGDELISIQQKPKVYQSRRSNAFAVNAALTRHAFDQNHIIHCADNLTELRKTLAGTLKTFDIVIFIGGISRGALDFIPRILKENKVKLIIHGVQQQPGKPFLFGQTKSGTAVFGLPGNPVSTLVCLYRYVIPYLQTAAGISAHQSCAMKLAGKAPRASRLTKFHPVKMAHLAGKPTQVAIIPYKNSADMSAWAKSDGFVEIPPNYKFNSPVKFFPW